MVVQVARVKNKWKCILKDGMIHVNGKDYLFAKCTGYVVSAPETSFGTKRRTASSSGKMEFRLISETYSLLLCPCSSLILDPKKRKDLVG